VTLLLSGLTTSRVGAQGCSRPNVPPTTVHAASPDLPAMAAQQGISGVVQVRVSLDANSHVVALSIFSSPSALLNAAALAAARASTFQTRIVNCTPVAVGYLFSVEFDSEYQPQSLVPTSTVNVQLGGTPDAPAAIVVVREVASEVPGRVRLSALLPFPGGDPTTVTHQADAAMRALVDRLRALGVAPAQIGSEPSYMWRATSFVETRSVVVDVTAAQESSVAAALSEAGAPHVTVLALHDPRNARQPLFQAAVARAERAARVFATDQGMTLGEVIEVGGGPVVDRLVLGTPWAEVHLAVTYAMHARTADR